MVFNKTCRTLSIYNFNEILLNKDLRFLIKGFDEYGQDDLILSESEEAEARDIYKSIIYEHAELTANNTIISKYKSEFLIESYEFKYKQALTILDLYSNYKDINLLLIFNRLGFKFSKEEDVNQQVEKIITSLKKLKTKISVLKIKHEEKFEKELNKGDEKLKRVDRLDAEALALELSLNLGYSINTKKTSVSKWITMWNISNKRNSKNNGKS